MTRRGSNPTAGGITAGMVEGEVDRHLVGAGEEAEEAVVSGAGHVEPPWPAPGPRAGPPGRWRWG